MEQEARLLDLLPKINSYTFDATDALVLMPPDGATIIARRR